MRAFRFPLILVAFAAAMAVADVPPGYYDPVDTSSQPALRATLHDVIDGHQRYPYTASSTDTWDILNQADEDPLDPGRILDVYRNRSIIKYPGGNSSYNREHVWPNSYGFPDDNSGNYPYTDCHHLMLCDISYNSLRGSNIFADCTSGCQSYPTQEYNGTSGVNYRAASAPIDIWETWDHRKGDIARAMFYMDVRYEGDTGNEPDLILTDDPFLIQSSQTGDNEPVAYMGLLSTLLAWHEADPVDDDERRRNDVVQQYQHNRNPFVDHPEWVDLLFDDGVTAAPAPSLLDIVLAAAPNPFNPATTLRFSLDRAARAEMSIYGLDGRRIAVLVSGSYPAGDHAVVWRGRDDAGRPVPSGAYVARLRSENQTVSRKILLLE